MIVPWFKNNWKKAVRVALKTIGWLIVSGLIIFTSNLSAGVPWKAALIGALVAKIGTTIAYLFYEVGFEHFWKKPEQEQEQEQEQAPIDLSDYYKGNMDFFPYQGRDRIDLSM